MEGLGGLVRGGTFKDVPSDPDEGVRPEWYDLEWVPLTHDSCGNHFCVDLDPAAGGTRGQVISFWHDDPQRVVMARSLGQWLNDFADELEAGKLVYSQEDGGIVEAGDG